MARVFAITTAATSFRLDPQGGAETSFTVSNASGRPLRGRAEVRATDPAQQAWLSVVGDVERDFPPNSTHQIAVRVAAPPGSPAGKSSFRLDMVSAQNPDEDFAEGPTVSFEVPAPAPKRRFPWWIVAVAAAVVLVIGGLTAYLTMREPAPKKEEVAAAPPPVAPAAPANEKLSLTGEGGAVPDGDRGGSTFDIVVSDPRAVAAKGNNVTVTLIGVTHGALGDLVARLEHPGYGPPVFLFDRVMNAGTMGCEADLRGTYVFSSAAPTTLQSQCVPIQPTVIPEGTYMTAQPDDVTNSNLSSAWNGKPVAGLWRLSLSDNDLTPDANKTGASNNPLYGNAQVNPLYKGENPLYREKPTETGGGLPVMNRNWTWRLEIEVSK